LWVAQHPEDGRGIGGDRALDLYPLVCHLFILPPGG
jgi:hypothetical protein